MLSRDLEHSAAVIDVMLEKLNEGTRVGVKELRLLQANILSHAEQARQIEAQVAPGSPIIDNVRHLAAEKRAAAG